MPDKSYVVPWGKRGSMSTDAEAAVLAELVHESTPLPADARRERFERSFAKSVGSRHAISVNSAAVALHMATRMLDLTPGDEVIATREPGPDADPRNRMTDHTQQLHTSTRAQDGTVLGYQRHGSGRPLVLLAGQANNHHWWDGVREDFHTTHSTLTMDYRGTGASGKPDGPYSTRLFADDVIAVLDDLGAERADVYGTSMGGRVAQWIAARHPDRVGRLVLGCTSPGGPQAQERDASVRRALAQADPTASRQALLDLMYSPAWLADHPGPYTTLGDPGMPPHARRGHLVASNEHDAWDALPRIVAPTLVLHGDQDRLTPAANAPLLAARIPRARMHLFTRARHAYFQECRPQAGRLVRAFLAGQEDLPLPEAGHS